MIQVVKRFSHVNGTQRHSGTIKNEIVNSFIHNEQCITAPFPLFETELKFGWNKRAMK